MKRSKLNLAWMLLLAVFAFASCDKDDEEKPILVEDGMYIVGEATPWADYDIKGQLAGGRNEAASNAERASLFEKYVALEAGKEFQIVEIAGKAATKYGPDAIIDHNTYGKYEQPNVIAKYGTYKVGGSFTVAESGLYQIAFDKELGKVAIIPVKYWAILGGATEAGWSDTKMELDGSFSKTSMKFKVTDLVLREGNYKLRHSGGWKFGLDDTLATATVKVNTNFGAAIDALVQGGADMAFAKANEGKYTVEINWSAETSGMGITATLTKTGNVDPLPEYPETLFMIGNGLNGADSDGDTTPDGWQWSLTDAPMIPVHSHAYMFWKIVWLEATGEVKFAPAKVWANDFGKDGDVSADTVWTKGGQNIPVPGTAGYYMVVVDLKANKISFADPKVFLIGDCVGGYDANVPANKFTVDNANSILTITKTLAAANLRMHTGHKWFPLQTPQAVDWWQAEFNIIDGTIQFRGKGNDQAAVPMTAGSKKIDLNFKTGVGTITAQ